MGDVSTMMLTNPSEDGFSFWFGLNPFNFYSAVYWSYKATMNCPETIKEETADAYELAKYVINNAKEFSATAVEAAQKLESQPSLAPNAALSFFGEIFSTAEAGETLSAAAALIGGMGGVQDLARCIAETNGYTP